MTLYVHTIFLYYLLYSSSIFFLIVHLCLFYSITRKSQPFYIHIYTNTLCLFHTKFDSYFCNSASRSAFPILCGRSRKSACKNTNLRCHVNRSFLHLSATIYIFKYGRHDQVFLQLNILIILHLYNLFIYSLPVSTSKCIWPILSEEWEAEDSSLTTLPSHPLSQWGIYLFPRTRLEGLFIAFLWRNWRNICPISLISQPAGVICYLLMVQPPKHLPYSFVLTPDLDLLNILFSLDI